MSWQLNQPVTSFNPDTVISTMTTIMNNCANPTKVTIQLSIRATQLRAYTSLEVPSSYRLLSGGLAMVVA